MTGPRVLVTGAGGFLGRHLCRRLASARVDIHAVSRGATPRHGDAARWWAAELEHEQEARDLVRAVKPDTVFHLGGLAHAAPEVHLVLPTFRSLLASTVNLLIAIAELGCERVVLVGSVEEPSTIDGQEAVPTSPYGAAKWAAGAYARMFASLYATPVVVARLALAYGPGQLERKVIPSAILSLLRGERPTVSNATRPWDLVYVDDAIEALLRIGEWPGLEGATVDVGSGEAVPLRAVIERIARMIDPRLIPDFGAVPERPFRVAATVDAAATESRIGWRATTPLDVGLRHTIDWYRDHALVQGQGVEV